MKWKENYFPHKYNKQSSQSHGGHDDRGGVRAMQDFQTSGDQTHCCCWPMLLSVVISSPPLFFLSSPPFLLSFFLSSPPVLSFLTSCPLFSSSSSSYLFSSAPVLFPLLFILSFFLSSSSTPPLLRCLHQLTYPAVPVETREAFWCWALTEQSWRRARGRHLNMSQRPETTGILPHPYQFDHYQKVVLMKTPSCDKLYQIMVHECPPIYLISFLLHLWI